MDKKYIAVPGRLESVAADGQIAGASQVYDDGRQKSQAAINDEFESGQAYLDNKISALQKQDVVPVDTLPAVADADPKKIYRVVGTDSYTDHMLNAAGDDFKILATYSFPGIDDKPTAGSSNLVKSGGVASEISRVSRDIHTQIRPIAEKTSNIQNVEENGIHVTDSQGNIAARVNENGQFDALGFGNNLSKKINENINEKIENAIVTPNQKISELSKKIAIFKETEEDGFYLLDQSGYIGMALRNGKLDVLGFGDSIKNLTNNNEADYKESISINSIFAELKRLKDATEASIQSMQSVKKSGNHFSSSFIIPASSVKREHVVVRVGVHKGHNLPGRPNIFNEVFFNGNCEDNFSDIRFIDGETILNTRKLHSGNYEVYRDRNFMPGYRVCSDQNGYIYNVRNGILHRSMDGGATFTPIQNAVANVSNIMGCDSRNYLYVNVRDQDQSHTSTYNKSPYVYILDLNNSFDQNDFVLICDMTFAGWQDTEEEVAADSVLMASTTGIVELDGYVFFGRYQGAYNPIIYRSINNTMTPDNGAYTKVVYDQIDFEVRNQHIHSLYASPQTGQVWACIDDSNNGVRCMYSTDYGLTWITWPGFITSEDWKAQRAIDYIPSYVSSDGTWMVGGGEAAILGGCTTCKVFNTIDTDGHAIPYKAERKVLTSQGSRFASAFSDDFVVTGLNSGHGSTAEAHILLITENGEKYETIYSQFAPGPNTDAGAGVRYFSKPFIPNSETEQVIYVDGLTSQIDTLRIVQGGDHYYGEFLVDVGVIEANEQKVITVESGFMMSQPNTQVLQRDFVEPVYRIPLDEGNGNIVRDSNGATHQIIGKYKWWGMDNEIGFGSYWPVQKPYDAFNGLRLDADSYIDLGIVPQLNFNKGFAITFWAAFDDILEDYRTLRYNCKQVLFSNSELLINKIRFYSIAYGNDANRIRVDNAIGPFSWHIWLPFVINVSDDSTPTISAAIGEDAFTTSSPSSSEWTFSHLSTLPLRIGCRQYEEGVEETIAYYISDIRIYDRPLTWQEVANMFYGRYREQNI